MHGLDYLFKIDGLDYQVAYYTILTNIILWF